MDCPPYAVIAWADERGVYVELPWQGSYSRVTFPPTTQGLADALAFLKAKQPKGPSHVFSSRENARVEAKAKLAKLGIRI